VEGHDPDFEEPEEEETGAQEDPSPEAPGKWGKYGVN